LIEALRGVADKSGNAINDPAMVKQLQDQGLMEEYKAALASLKDIKQDDYTLIYLVQPDKTGKLTLPAFTVTSGGQKVETQPIALNVTEPQPQNWVRVNLSLSNPAPMPGDEVQLYVDLMIRRGPVTLGGRNYPHFPVKDMTLSVPTLEGVARLELARPLEQLLAEHAIQPGQHGFHVNNVPGEYLLDHEAADAPKDARDPQWYRRRLSLPVRVREAGPAVIPPARAAGEVYLAASAKRGEWVPFTASSEPLSVNGRSLKDSPKDYTGGVGTFRLTAKASQTSMPAGTPFVFTLRQEGEGNLARATPPDLNARSAFADRFAIHLESDRLLSDGVREFTYTLRPRSEAVTEVPSVTVSSFNPKADRFETARSEPIPLQVTPAPAGGAAAAPAAASAPADTTAPVEEEAAPPGPSFLSAAAKWVGIPLGLLLCVAGMVLARREFRKYRIRRAARNREHQEMDAARQRLHAPHLSIDDVRRAMQDFLRARFALPPGEITPKDAEERLAQAGYGEKLARWCAEVMTRCEAAEFAPGSAPPAAELAASAERVLRAILTAKPRLAVAATATTDELTREREAAVAG
jgi:hypothetical protein